MPRVNAAKFGPKLTPMEREKALTLVEECLGKSIPYRSIVVMLKQKLSIAVSIQQITKYKKKLYKRHAERQSEVRSELIAEKKHQFETIREYCWRVLELSEKDVETITEELGPLPEAKDSKGQKLQPKRGSVETTLRIIKKIHEKKGRLPQGEWMRFIIDTLKEEMRMDALVLDIHIGDKVSGDKVQGDKNVLDWNAIMEPSEVTDPAQEAIEAKVVSSKPSEEQ